jgi:hypothetical protein
MGGFQCVCETGGMTCIRTINSQARCNFCGEPYKDAKAWTCPCRHGCSACHRSIPKREFFHHRCPIYCPVSEKDSAISDSDHQNNGQYQCWAWDIESSLDRTYEVYKTPKFDEDEHAYVTNENNEYVLIEERILKHTPVLICVKNVMTRESHDFYTMENFIEFMEQNNGGRNILIAHNSSGYDSRIFLTYLIGSVRNFSKDALRIVTRGSKILELRYKDIVFRDSMLFLPGSLASLAKAFGLEIAKGYFPHLFNSHENQGYAGQIPDKNWFGLNFICKNQNDIDKFNEWYSSYEGVWDLKTELIKYCRNDVDILAEICFKYNEINMKKHKISPWVSTTGPSFIHKVIYSNIAKKIDADLESYGSDASAHKNFYRYSYQLAEKYWPVLKAYEYWHARRALRGGRTEVRTLHYELSEAEIARGCQIKYVDVVSLYPYCQIAFQYPRGLPRVYVYNRKFLPCKEHKRPINSNSLEFCNCKKEFETNYSGFFTFIQDPTQYWFTEHDCLSIVTCDIEPPKDLFHPVLVTFNEDSKKCIASLETIIEGTFTSVELLKALEKGYRLIKVHREDVYKSEDALWNENVIDGFVDKCKYSKSTPESIREMIEMYGRIPGYGEKISNKIRNDYADDKENWCFNAAGRAAAKQAVNCMWGKNVQRVVMPTTHVLNRSSEEYSTIMNALEMKLCSLRSYVSLNDDLLKISKEDLEGAEVDEKRRDYAQGFVTAGLFVPAYGRMVLYEQLEKLNERVLYHDTDSIIYIYDPQKYNIPQGNLLGEWEEEDISKNGNILEFISTGPKSYAIRTRDGNNVIKLKGVSNNAAISKILNFDALKDMVFNAFEVEVPQSCFEYKYDQGMTSRTSMKHICFNRDELKGELRGLTLFPFGHQ